MTRTVARPPSAPVRLIGAVLRHPAGMAIKGWIREIDTEPYEP